MPKAVGTVIHLGFGREKTLDTSDFFGHAEVALLQVKQVPMADHCLHRGIETTRLCRYPRFVILPVAQKVHYFSTLQV